MSISPPTSPEDQVEIQPESGGSSTPEASAPAAEAPQPAGVRSLRELIQRVSGQGFRPVDESEGGLAEILPFPFLGIVAQEDMKLALLLALINPGIGGVLLIGPRGTGKTTAVRSLIDLLPQIQRSLCHYGCLPEDIESGGLDAVCPDCAQKFALSEALAHLDRVRLVDLPLNARLEDVVGGLDERAAVHERVRVRRGLLAQADRNLLYVDEVNLLEDTIADSILDASSQGLYTVRRGGVSATYNSRFVLIGSMNPEEGRLRPQILDRFGLRVLVRGLLDPAERLEAYRRVQAYSASPRTVISHYAEETAQVRQEIQAARQILPSVTIPDETARLGLALIEKLQIDSLRAEITLFEAARACAAASGRSQVEPEDLRMVASLALRLRRSNFMEEFFAAQSIEENEIDRAVEAALEGNPPAASAPNGETLSHEKTQ